MKKDRKIISILFSIEAFMLAVLLIVAFFCTGNFEKSIDGKLEAPKRYGQLFPNSLYLNYFSSNSAYEPTDSQGVEYNYYTFNLTSEGITSNLFNNKEGLTSGLASSSLSDAQMMIKAAPNASNPTILSYGNLYIQNPYLRKNLSLKEVLSEPLQLKKLGTSNEPTVLIYHTHTREAYCVTEADRYNVKAAYNESKDNTKNVVAAGNEIMHTLLGKNIVTHHDTTVHTEQRINGDWKDCYYFGKQTLSSLLETYKEAQLVLDIHRDGVTDPNRDKIRHKTVVTDENGREYAQIMLVVGLNYNASFVEGDEFNPHWKDNFKLALLVIEKLEEKVPGISRGISLRREAYNQNLAQNTLLVEMGFDGNLVSEVSASSQLLGEVLAEIYS